MSDVTIYAKGMRVYGGKAWTVHADGRVEFHGVEIYDRRDRDLLAAGLRDKRAGRMIHGDCVRGGCQKLLPSR